MCITKSLTHIQSKCKECVLTDNCLYTICLTVMLRSIEPFFPLL